MKSANWFIITRRSLWHESWHDTKSPKREYKGQSLPTEQQICIAAQIKSWILNKPGPDWTCISLLKDTETPREPNKLGKIRNIPVYDQEVALMLWFDAAQLNSTKLCQIWNVLWTTGGKFNTLYNLWSKVHLYITGPLLSLLCLNFEFHYSS